MFEENIPQKIDPFRFADNATRLRGILLVKNMERLTDNLFDDSGEIKVVMEFGKDEQGRRFLKGELSGTLHLQCQRCMGLLVSKIANTIELVIVDSEKEASELPSGYDFVIVSDNMLIIKDIVEDDLIINLPLVPMHHSKECSVKLPIVVGSAEIENENPFKVIEFLRKKNDRK